MNNRINIAYYIDINYTNKKMKLFKILKYSR